LSVALILTAIVLLSVSGLPACLMSARSLGGQRVASLLMALGSAAGLWGVGASVSEATPPALRVPWFLPWGEFSIAVDPISAVFLGLVFVVPALGSIYGLGYWKQTEHPENGRWLGLFYGLLAGSMALVVIARDGVLFLGAWEAMALAAYFALATEEDNLEVRRVSWVYLVATHCGTLCLFAMFALWNRATGSFALNAAEAMPAALASAIFVLALIGFSFKAGFFPFHFWLPGAHANAPSHVSAVLSSVMLKMGIYGIVRMSALLPAPPPWWGETLLALGALTGLAGIVFALSQHDFKRLLAYSSVENVGIIGMGVGLALLGRSMGRVEWVLLGLGAALFHVWNHGLFKSLLFFNAGAILHATNTRDIDRLGGLGRLMPKACILFAVGAIAICALPPLNGFAGEFILYVGLFRTLGFNGEAGVPAAAVAAVALAAIGALAVACFVKLFGMVFLGAPRSEAVSHAHDPRKSMLLPMALLAGGCAALGIFPTLGIPLFERACRAWGSIPESNAASIAALVPLNALSMVGLGLLGLAALATGILLLTRRLKTARCAGTWDCGYAQPTHRMQYTGTSFGQMLTDLFSFLLWPKDHRPAVEGEFPAQTYFKRVIPDLVLERLLLPSFHWAARRAQVLRFFQQGQTQLYVLYVVLILIVLLAI